MLTLKLVTQSVYILGGKHILSKLGQQCQHDATAASRPPGRESAGPAPWAGIWCKASFLD